MDPAAEAMALPPGFQVIALDRVGSTNDEAKDRARLGAPEGTVVWALRQENGRGRRGRGWSSPEGNLYTSTILRPGLGPAVTAQLSFVTALAISDLAISLMPSAWPVRCKWPNDVLVNGRKVSGILLEAESTAVGNLDWVVIGAGVNLRHHPRDVETAATSMLAEGAVDVSVAEALGLYIGHLAARFVEWRCDGFAATRRAWLDRASGLGAPIVVRLADTVVTGVFADLDSDGVLLLDRTDGHGRQRIAAGDVFFPGFRDVGGTGPGSEVEA